MKRIKYLYFSSMLFMGAISISACTDMLTEKPENTYEKDGYFIREENAEMAVIGTYEGLTEDYNLWGSDDIYYSTRVQNDNAKDAIFSYIMTPANQIVNTAWKAKYKTLNRANYTIEGIQGMDGYRNNEILQSYVAEAMFIRAMVSFDLVRMWGDVPYATEYSKSYEATYKPRTDRELIYDRIISDLTFAKQHLAWGTASSSPERATQGAARALLMRVLLQRTGYSLQMDGTLKRPDNDKRQEYFKAIIEGWKAFQEEGKFHGFYEDDANSYEALFKSFSGEILNNKESLFEIAFQYPNRKGSLGSIIGVQVAQAIVSGNEKNNVMGRASVQYRCLPEWGNFYEATDQRREVMVATHVWNWDKEKHTHVKKDISGYAFVGKWRREWMPLGYDELNATDVNFCYIRYAEVVLSAAEAYNELGETAKAWELINRVRDRAKATKLNAGNYNELMKAPQVLNLDFIDDSNEAGKIRTVLYWERAFELACEGVRKYDLIRWGILKEALQLIGSQTSVNTDRNTPFPAGNNFQSGKHELFPIPEDEMQVNHTLNGKNNPGY